MVKKYKLKSIFGKPIVSGRYRIDTVLQPERKSVPAAKYAADEAEGQHGEPIREPAQTPALPTPSIPKAQEVATPPQTPAPSIVPPARGIEGWLLGKHDLPEEAKESRVPTATELEAVPETTKDPSSASATAASTGSVILPRPSDAWQRDVDGEQARHWDQLGTRSGFPPAVYRIHVRQSVRQLASDAEHYIRRRRSSTLQKILEGGRFKTQFETYHSSGAINDLDIRRETDLNVMGVPVDIHPELRPVYGYLSGADFAEARGDEITLDDYGSIILRLKPEVAERATATVGDSLNASNGGRAANLLASPVGRMSYRSVPVKYWTGTYVTSSPDQDLRSWQRLRSVVPYFETHYHGGLRAEHIRDAAVVEPEFGLLPPDVQRGIEILNHHGIPVMIIPVPTKPKRHQRAERFAEEGGSMQVILQTEGCYIVQTGQQGTLRMGQLVDLQEGTVGPERAVGSIIAHTGMEWEPFVGDQATQQRVLDLVRGRISR